MKSKRLAWALNLFAVWMLVSQGPQFIAKLAPPPDVALGDFFQEWASASNWRFGYPIYEHQAASADRYLNVRARPGQTLYIEWNAHPPVSVLASLPFAFLGYRAALLAWHAIAAGCMAVAAFLVGRELGWSIHRWMILPALAAPIVCNPLRQQFNQGQWNGVLLLLVVLGWVALRRHRDFAGGLALGTAAAIKLFPLFLVAGPMFRRHANRLSIAMGGAISIAVLHLMAWFVLGTTAFVDYAAIVDKISAFRDSWRNHSIVGVATRSVRPTPTDFHRTFVPERPLVNMPRLALLGYVLAGLVVAFEFWRWRQVGDRDGIDRAFASSVTAMLLLSPLSWDHGLVLLFLPAAVVWPAVAGRAALARWLYGATLFLLSLDWATIWQAYVERGANVAAAANPILHLGYAVPFFALAIFYVNQCHSTPISAAHSQRDNSYGRTPLPGLQKSP